MTGQGITEPANAAQVFYRKWRPTNFSQLVGQEHVSATLRQAIRLGRISHSYLFCGPRGCGKTTTARIIAKAANCLDVQDGDPCDACANCRSVNSGQFMDIIELDAASNRGIDEIRDIRDKVNFAPAHGKRKVYIIDEAHMLTDAASNAFLKTLEEPPPHVIFVLCTTEAHRILPTIISRCQRFDFRRISSELIYGRLADIAEAESVSAEPEALRQVARHAAGSLRDAENLLEQLVVSSTEGVTLKQVEEFLGLDNSGSSLELVKYLLMGNTSAALTAVNKTAWGGTDLRQLHRQTTELLRAVMHLQWGSEDAVDLSDDVTAQLRELVGHLPPWRIVKALKVWGDVNMRYDAPSTLPLELAVVEICEDTAPPAAQPAPAAPTVRSVAPAQQPSRAPSAAPPPQRRAADQGQPDARPAARTPVQPTGQRRPAPDAGPISEIGTQWLAAVKVLGRHKGKKYNLGALLRDCKANAVSVEGTTLVLGFSNKANLERMQEEMGDPNSRRQVSEAVADSFGATYELTLKMANGNGSTTDTVKTAQQSSLVRTALGMGARVLEEIEE
ncbi:MAG: DNA polymerase III subunit gamma/tau [Chloroflexi bacterium]|nr:DNA polymerase III subunit gamma/tau [Chloroflexota bacterium]